jgi:serine/threonine protein kinase
MDQLLNQVLHDRYRIESLLGRQTGRRTFLAVDLQTEARVVVKLLLFGPDFEWDDLKLFEREAAVLESLDHPAIPHYLDGFDVETELGKGFALVQSYLEAQTLQAWIQVGRTFSELELKAIAQELLGVLDYLHSRSPAVVHRDLKPSNILLGDRSGNSPGQVYLVDFGSVQTAVHGGTRTVVGTYGYMPPEQFGGQTSPAVDLYALGATLIYLATRQHPDKLPQRELRILFADRTSSLSPPFINWLQSLTEPSLDLRCKSAAQALETLESQPFVESHLTIAPQPPHSKVKLTKSSESFEIWIPPIGVGRRTKYMRLFAISTLGLALITAMIARSHLLDAYWYSQYCTIPAVCAPLHLEDDPVLWIVPLSSVLAALSILDIRYCLFGSTRLRITQSEISIQRTNRLGFREKNLSVTIMPQTIVELQQFTNSPAHRKDVKSKPGKVSPEICQLNIWAGSQAISLGRQTGVVGVGTSLDRLTPFEVYWLAQELSSWLNLPII